MTKRKVNRDKSKVRPKRKPWFSRLFHFLALPPIRRLILVVIILAILFWQWSALTSQAAVIRDNTIELYGWGLLLIIIAIGALVIMIWRHKLSSLIFHWNQWLGVAAVGLAIWGTLGLIDLGGSFGRSIISSPDLGGSLRVLGLAITGIVLIAPGFCFHSAVHLITWAGKKIKKQPHHQPAPQERVLYTPSLSPAPKSSTVVSPKLTEEKPTTETIIPVPTTTQDRQELRQVAQEVRRKYNESPTLITIDGWQIPPLDILDITPEVEFAQADNMQRARFIEEALSSYGVETKVIQINSGPTVTQFGVEPGWDRKFKEIKERDKDGNVKVILEEVSKIRVKVERITSLANDLALALAAPTLRIEAPVPGKSVVGIEVPNTTSSLVSLRSVIETSVFQKIKTKSNLCLALGKGAGGEATAADLSKMPHLLVAGATGSGKTVCLNAIICCLLMHNTPNDVRFIMVDPKRVELTPYNSIPHLATPIIVDTNKALTTMRWLSQEMDKRYQKLAGVGARNIEGYNKNCEGDNKLPYLVLIIDELADLMMTGFDEVEHILCRLAQLARATGIHLIVATQRPSVDVVTGLIKANFPTRISFAVTSQVDSRTILDSVGAEKLLGRGDMLYMPTEAAKPKRLQGCLVSDAEIERLVYFWGSQQKPETGHISFDEITSASISTVKRDIPQDPLLDTARQLAQEHTHISTSYIQRCLRVGYPRAARIMEQLEKEDIEKE
ncbi:DNA translocase FtsK [Chloroflexota bacterium]